MEKLGHVARVLDGLPKLPWSAYVGVCGMPGQTAFYGWNEYSKVKPVAFLHIFPYCVLGAEATDRERLYSSPPALDQSVGE